MTIEELLSELDLLKSQLRSQEQMTRLLMAVFRNLVERVVALEASIEEVEAKSPTLIGAESSRQ